MSTSKLEVKPDNSLGLHGRIIGTYRRFAYPREFVSLAEYTARRGQRVKVLRRLTQREADQGDGCEWMYRIQAADGWIGDAWASEIRRSA